MENKVRISREEYAEFDVHLQEETDLLEQWFAQGRFSERELEAGSEIEFFLLDNNYLPSPDNMAFINKVNEKFLIPEIGKAHLEINSTHTPLTKDCLNILHQDILRCWKKCCGIAQENDVHLALIGSLPTATEAHQKLNFLTQNDRYKILSSTTMEQADNQSLTLDIKGKETLKIQPAYLTINGLISAFQLHIQIGLNQSVRYYNTVQAISGPMMALCCNSPFMSGRNVWADTRIFIFDEIMTIPRLDRSRGFKCCLFGTGYLKDSFYEMFEENNRFFPRLMPLTIKNAAPEEMRHVRLQNGVVYRWNRPVIDFNSAGIPHLRIEHRGPSSGPTVIDMIANAAFFYGIINYLALNTSPVEYLLPFTHARNNFFNAARYGMEAEFTWFLGKQLTAAKLLKELLPLAAKGLQTLGIIQEDVDYYLNIIEQRIKTKTNGSDWQRRFVDKYGRDFHAMMASYLQNQYSELPIFQWKI